jgi:hypothetical protein
MKKDKKFGEDQKESLLNKRGYISLVIHKKLNEKLISKA